MNDVGLRHEVTHRHFPEMADRITTCRALVLRLFYISLFHLHFVIMALTFRRDKAIPSLHTASKSTSADQDSLELNRLSIIVGNQIKQEKNVCNHIREQNSNTYPNLRTEAQAPPPASEFQTARLLLSHLGYIIPQVCQR